MTVREIVTPPAEVLRQKAKPVSRIDRETQMMIDDMIETMREANGVGLAAPQIGKSLQLTVIETPPEYDDEGNEIPESRELFVLINPEITWQSRQTKKGIEGCLSIPGYVGEVERAESVRVRALNRAGKRVNLRFKDWPARILQHEVDHLLGILFIDRLTSPENLWTEEEYEEIVEKARAQDQADTELADVDPQMA